MWNYEPGQMRCGQNHVFYIEEVVGGRKTIVRIDRPSMVERLRDYAAGCASGCAITLAALLASGVI